MIDLIKANELKPFLTDHLLSNINFISKELKLNNHVHLSINSKIDFDK